MDIVEFLRARLGEDEAVARAARGDDGRLSHGFEVREDWGRWALLRRYGSLDVVDEDGNQVTFDQEGLSDSVGSQAIGEHIARHDPARVLREVEAKRRIVEQAGEANSLDMQVDSEFRLGARDMDDEPYCGDVILRALASVYADHPDYDPAWTV